MVSNLYSDGLIFIENIKKKLDVFVVGLDLGKKILERMSVMYNFNI